MEALESLPKGRHGLSRTEVAASQRTRLLRAAVELGTERGFAALTLADIVGHAGVARSTFYEHFADKQECFLEAFDHAAELVIERVLAIEPPSSAGYPTPMHAYLAVFLDLCVEEPGLARLVAADVDALGPAAVDRQRAIRGRIADGLVAQRDFFRRTHPHLPPISQMRALAFVGAISEVLKHTFHTAGVDAIPGLQAELATIVVAILEAPAA